MLNTSEQFIRQLPQLGHFLQSESGRALLCNWPRALVLEAARNVFDRMREQIRAGAHTEETLAAALEDFASQIADELRTMTQPSLRKIINATGVILQTNLGRAPLSNAAVESVRQIARGYCNLELDLSTGERGRRDSHVEILIQRVLALRSGKSRKGTSAAVVNNCAAATFLTLNTLAEGGEVIVSRGELVEIGGGFRIPDILRKSGAVLCEVGTTNRTRIEDYAAAITAETRLILRVHRSNFQMQGFVEQPSLSELVALGAEASVPVFVDQGTGCIMQLEGESNWAKEASSGAALVSASGDKLLGGPQCGILVGEERFIQRIRANPLARAFRVDKMTYAALEATLLAYLKNHDHTIPAIAMLRASPDELHKRCLALIGALQQTGFKSEIVPVESIIGGGTTPGAVLSSYAIALQHSTMSETDLAAALRHSDPPVIARIAQSRVLLDLRTVLPEEDAVLAHLLSAMEARS